MVLLVSQTRRISVSCHYIFLKFSQKRCFQMSCHYVILTEWLFLGRMSLYFSDFITEVPFSDVVPLGRFRRVIFLGGCDINCFHRACDISRRDIIYEPSGRLKW